jgi:hypothetical protein
MFLFCLEIDTLQELILMEKVHGIKIKGITDGKIPLQGGQAE